jgi:pilus assembly protein CpaE
MMKKNINMAVAVQETLLADSICDLARSIHGVQSFKWNDSKKGTADPADRTTPEIIIIDDNPEEAKTLAELSALKSNFPESAIFVVSTNQNPQHIINVMKGGGAEYFLIPVDQTELRRAIEEVHGKCCNNRKPGKGAIYSFISSKGGLGSTVLSVNTATALAMNGGGEVALCDTAFQAGDSSVLLDLVPENTIADLCSNFQKLDNTLLRGAMIRHASGLQLLAAPLHPEESEKIRHNHIARILDLLGQLYDNVVIDCSSMFVNHHSIEIFNASNLIFVVTDLSVPAIRNALRMDELIRKLGVADQKIEFVVNRYSKGSTLPVAEAQKALGKNFFWLFPNHFDDIVSSINEGKPVVQSHPRSGFSKNITEFVEKLHSPEKHNGYRGIRAVFGRAI